jgi:hypothetical protein
MQLKTATAVNRNWMYTFHNIMQLEAETTGIISNSIVIFATEHGGDSQLCKVLCKKKNCS